MACGPACSEAMAWLCQVCRSPAACCWRQKQQSKQLSKRRRNCAMRFGGIRAQAHPGHGASPVVNCRFSRRVHGARCVVLLLHAWLAQARPCQRDSHSASCSAAARAMPTGDATSAAACYDRWQPLWRGRFMQGECGWGVRPGARWCPDVAPCAVFLLPHARATAKCQMQSMSDAIADAISDQTRHLVRFRAAPDATVALAA